jgi:CheY-like chemotaxis protein
MTDAAQLLPPRILVVDDERQIHASIRLRLGGSYDIACAYDAREALEKIRHVRFDLCLVDIHMPRMDGLTFIDAAQALDPDLGFVVLSAFDSNDNLRRAIPLQVFDFLPKPFPEVAEFEGRIPAWVEMTRHRRREQKLAREAGIIAEDRDAARLERDVEMVASETARDALRQTAGLLTTVHAHLLSATTQLAARARTDSSLVHLLRGLEEARKTSDAAMIAAESFFDSSYGSRDASPALPEESIRHAIDIATRISGAAEAGKVVDFLPAAGNPPVRDLSGIEFLLMLIPALGAALAVAAPHTTAGIRTALVSRLDAVTKDPLHRDLLWLNRKRALGSHPALVITITATAAPLSVPEVEAWLGGNHAPLARITSRGLLPGIAKCRGVFGAAVAPAAARFCLVLALPT